MAVFRVEKNKGYTVMSNYHLNDKTITLKAKGLLSQMLSLPESWDYTLKGLACINRESVDAIRTAVLELEQRGYIIRQQGRDAGGNFTAIEYVIYEQPKSPLLENPITVEPRLEKPLSDNPISVNPKTENPVSDKPLSENPTQLNTKKSSNQETSPKEINTHVSSIHQSIYPAESEATEPTRAKEIDRIDRIEAYRDLIMENIEYECLCGQYGRERTDEVVEIMLETVCSTRPYIRIAGDEYPAEVVRSRLLKLGQFHVEYVFNCLDKNTTKVYNIKNYLLTALYNAPATMDSYYRAEVNHDLYGDI